MTLILRIAAASAAACLLRAADTPKEFIEVTRTEHVDFPSAGTLRLPNSTGYLTIEAWDRPDIEITTVKTVTGAPGEREKATQDLDTHHLVVKREGDGVVISTNSTWYSNHDLEYRIKAPVSAHLIVNHHAGDVTVDGLSGDMDISLREGQLILRLPGEGRYHINAKCDIGNVNSDYPGQEKRLWWLIGHRIENGNAPSAAHKLNLKVHIGDILILNRHA